MVNSDEMTGQPTKPDNFSRRVTILQSYPSYKIFTFNTHIRWAWFCFCVCSVRVGKTSVTSFKCIYDIKGVRFHLRYTDRQCDIVFNEIFTFVHIECSHTVYLKQFIIIKTSPFND